MADERFGLQRTEIAKMDRSRVSLMLTDIVGYSARMNADEARTLSELEKHNQIVQEQVNRFNGRTVKTIGDAFMVEFTEATPALRCALAIHQALNQAFAGPNPLQVRIGLHFAEVSSIGPDLFGDGVNILSRIEPHADPGGICASNEFVKELGENVVPFAPLGPVQMKHIARPMELFVWPPKTSSSDGAAKSVQPPTSTSTSTSTSPSPTAARTISGSAAAPVIKSAPSLLPAPAIPMVPPRPAPAPSGYVPDDESTTQVTEANQMVTEPPSKVKASSSNDTTQSEISTTSTTSTASTSESESSTSVTAAVTLPAPPSELFAGLEMPPKDSPRSGPSFLGPFNLPPAPSGPPPSASDLREFKPISIPLADEKTHAVGDMDSRADLSAPGLRPGPPVPDSSLASPLSSMLTPLPSMPAPPPPGVAFDISDERTRGLEAGPRPVHEPLEYVPTIARPSKPEVPVAVTGPAPVSTSDLLSSVPPLVEPASPMDGGPKLNGDALGVGDSSTQATTAPAEVTSYVPQRFPPWMIPALGGIGGLCVIGLIWLVWPSSPPPTIGPTQLDNPKHVEAPTAPTSVSTAPTPTTPPAPSAPTAPTAPTASTASSAPVAPSATTVPTLAEATQAPPPKQITPPSLTTSLMEMDPSKSEIEALTSSAKSKLQHMKPKERAKLSAQLDKLSSKARTAKKPKDKKASLAALKSFIKKHKL
jgi:class 3 adenylate cyclase